MDEAGYHAITDLILDRLMVRARTENPENPALCPTETPALRPTLRSGGVDEEGERTPTHRSFSSLVTNTDRSPPQASDPISSKQLSASTLALTHQVTGG